MFDRRPMLDAPWTDEQVARLNEYQTQSGYPLVAGATPGIATPNGWVLEPGGPVVSTSTYLMLATGEELARIRYIRHPTPENQAQLFRFYVQHASCEPGARGQNAT